MKHNVRDDETGWKNLGDALTGIRSEDQIRISDLIGRVTGGRPSAQTTALEGDGRDLR